MRPRFSVQSGSGAVFRSILALVIDVKERKGSLHFRLVSPPVSVGQEGRGGRECAVSGCIISGWEWSYDGHLKSQCGEEYPTGVT